jgi:cell division protein FtsI (penicillin-binding protein 3)
MQGALRLMDVPPDDIETWLAAQAKEEARRKPPVAVAQAPAQASVQGAVQ